MDVESVATANRLKMMRLEDGEVVIPLRGGRKDRYPSNSPHAGIWSETEWYALVPCPRPGRTVDAACAFDWALTFKITDNAAIVFGAPTSILSLITKGPLKFRAKSLRKVSAETLALLRKHGFAAQGAPLRAVKQRGPA